VRLGIRSATLLFGVLALLVSGCGTLSGSRASQSALLASASVSSANPVVTDQPSVAPRAVVTAPAETRVDTGGAAEPTATPSADALPVALEPGAAAQPPSSQEASTAPLVSQAAPADPAPAQKRGTVDPIPDVQIEEYDPWEPFNEKMFKFNYNFDKYLFKPVAKGYNFVMPDLFQQMIGHGFDNINVVPKLANNLLQWNLKGFGTELGRFLINSTLGIGGLFDIAKQEFGLQKTKVDFGQTLGKWGVGPGPFLILPFMPPLTVRDGIGTAADGAMDPLSYVLPFIWDRLGMKIGDQLNDRSLNLDLFQGFEETTVDLYSAVRNGYLQRRYNMIKGTP
jgi:phospholipid-binding lipoprotein MlaA